MRLPRLAPRNTKIDFVGARWFGFAFTGISILAAVISIWLQGFNFGIDFTGGVIIEARKTNGVVDFDAMRGKLSGLGFGEVALQDFGSSQDILIRVQPGEGVTGQEQAVVAKIREALGSDYDIRRTDSVGAKVSGELLFSGTIACFMAVLMIAAYVAFRFEWQFGVAAFVATFHDVFITAGLFSLFQMDFNLTSVAALLTLAGYSINDTVVVFDRIRENRRRYKKLDLRELINLSTNETLARTLMTSVTTSIAIVPLAIWGGDVLQGFAISILFGITVGTYSSIYVASALLLYLKPISGMEPMRADTEAAARP